MKPSGSPDRGVIQGLTAADREHAVELLSRAFLHDPLMTFVMEDLDPGENRIHGIASLMDFSLMIREVLKWPILGLFVDKSPVGIAALSLDRVVNWPRSLEQKQDALHTLIGSRGATRLETYGAIVENQRPSAPHIYLGVLGVEPAAQGLGYGRRLLDAVQDLSERHQASEGVYLDTENPENVRFYERCGYVVTSQHELEGVMIWCLFRHNR